MSKFKVGDRVTPNEDEMGTHSSLVPRRVYTVTGIHYGGLESGIVVDNQESYIWHYDRRFDLAPDPADEAWETFAVQNPYSTREAAFRAGWRASDDTHR